jgi:acetyltransferase-like isoleucine patch superfamily enzyme
MNYSFKNIGNNVKIYEPVVLIKPESIHLENNIIISEFAYLTGGQGLFIGNNIHIATGVVISGGGICILEDFVGISAGAKLITGTDDINGNGIPSPTVGEKYRSFYRSYVICKKHSFISTNVIIHPGVVIGEGSVIGSGSVVTKDIEPWGIYIGSPAKRIKDRPKDRILELEKKYLDDNQLNNSNFNEIEKSIFNQSKK